MKQNLKGEDHWTSRGQQSHGYTRAFRRESSGAVTSGAAGARVAGSVSKAHGA